MTDKSRPSARYLLAALAAATLLSATSCELLLDVLVASSDGGGGDESPVTLYSPINTSYAKTIGGSTAINISTMNGTEIYTLVSFLPADKRESNNTTTLAEQDWTFYSTAVIAGSSSPRSIGSFQSKPVYTSAQATCDEQMRTAENKLLASNTAGLARQLAVTTSLSANPIVVGTAWTDMYIVSPVTMINATCRKVSGHAFFFVDDDNYTDGVGGDITDIMLSDYASRFDTIYDLNRLRFGTESDVDLNDKVIIVLTSIITDGVLGYFNPNDKFNYSASSNPNSNEGDIFYITARSAYASSVPATMAHEFQHMIYFDQHIKAGTSYTYIWLNEALSQAAEYYYGDVANHVNWMKSFLSVDWYGLSLTNWTDDNYGYGAIFIRYLIEKYGDTAIRNMCSTGKVGIAAVEAATGVDFNTIFYNFTLALALSGTNRTNDTKFNFIDLDLQALRGFSAGSTSTALASYSGDSFPITAGTNFSWWNYPYEIFFFKRTGAFNTVALTGTDIIGTAFDLD